MEQNLQKSKGTLKKKEADPVPIEKTHMDFPFFIVMMLLLVIGLVSLFSASHVHAYYYYKDSYNFIFKQTIFASIGVVIMLIAATLDFRIIEKLAWPICIVSFILLIIVFGFRDLNNAHRWIIIGSFTFQPSELAKFAIVIVFAMLLKVNEQRIQTLKGLLPFILLLGAYAVLILLERHISGTILVVLLGALMLFVGGAKISHLLALAGIGSLLGFLIIKSGIIQYAGNRFAVWLDPWKFAKGLGYQNIQALYAIGSGGFMGVGVGNSSQKQLYLPEPQNDFIFAIVAEEVGFVGATIIILLFALLVWRGFVIATRCPDRFGSLVAAGFTAQVGIQTILNIMVVTKIIPNTGISLPFFSAGGTSLIMLLGQMGVVLSISRYRKASQFEKEE